MLENTPEKLAWCDGYQQGKEEVWLKTEAAQKKTSARIKELESNLRTKDKVIQGFLENICFYYGMCRALHEELKDGQENTMKIRTPDEMFNKVLEGMLLNKKITKDEYNNLRREI